MDRVLVTGALGTVGRWTVDRLAEDYDVVGVDVSRPTDPRHDVDYRAGDLTDQGVAWDLVSAEEPDAVVHLAAIPSVELRARGETFRTNVDAAYNVLTVAGEAGVPVVWTSSECAYGEVFSEEPRLPEYLPIDTDHRADPADPYGTSKVASEAVATMVARRYGIQVTTVRPSWVQEPGEYDTASAREAFDPADPDPVGNYWSYVDVRDLVGLFRAALAVGHDGHEIYNAMAAENYIDYPTVDAIEAAFGDLPERCAIEGEASAFSTADARRDLGWAPEYTWRTAEDEDVPDPER